MTLGIEIFCPAIYGAKAIIDRYGTHPDEGR